MQAQPLSIPAARIPSLSLTPSVLRKASNPSLLPPAAAPLLPAPVLAPPAREAHLTQPPIAEQAGLAHDAGNLLSALRLYSDLLRTPGVLRPEHQHYASELGLIAARSSTLIQRLLTAAPAAPASRTQPDLAALEHLPQQAFENPATVLRTLAPVLDCIAAGAATVSVNTPGSVPLTDLPAEALERIAVNLVRNAAEAIRCSRSGPAAAATLHSSGPLRHLEPGRIRLTLEVFAGALRLTVEDNGPGMPPAVAAAFLRPGTMPIHAGRGLGHRIVHELIEATGGKLSIRVRPGTGTALCVRWPLAAKEDVVPC